MLRSHITRTQITKCRSFLKTGQRSFLSPGNGRMSDVLAILGPLRTAISPKETLFFVGCLRKCVRTGDSVLGNCVHVNLIKLGLGSDPLVCNVLLDVYAKIGLLDDGLKVFEEMPVRDVASWCGLISGFVRFGFAFEAFWAFKVACRSDVRVNGFVVSAVLKGCLESGVAEMGWQVHGFVEKSGLGFDGFVEVGLVDMYAKCGCLDCAVRLFYAIPVKIVVMWNVMISCFVKNKCFVEAIKLSLEMCRTGYVMDVVTSRVVASAVSALGFFKLFKNLIGYYIKTGLSSDCFVVAEYVRLLARLGEVEYMRKLFTAVKKPDASLLCLTISGLHYNDCRNEAVELAEKLLALGYNLNEGALISVLDLCFHEKEGVQIHARVLKTGHCLYISVSNALISLYSKFGNVSDAEAIFSSMPVHDMVSWTAIMTCFVQNLQFVEALELFRTFIRTRMKSDQYPFSVAINACIGLQAISQGEQIHLMALKLGIECFNFVNASLLHMYIKCGFLKSATRLFSYLPCPRGLVPTNIMLAGFGWNIQPEKTLELFVREHQLGFVPDNFSFATVLSACADLRSTEMGEQLHARVAKSGFELSDVVVCNAIMNCYMKCERISYALKYFDGMIKCDSYSYAVVILGYVQVGNVRMAMRLLFQTIQSGYHVYTIALTTILRICSNLADVNYGKQLHAFVTKVGYETEIYVGKALTEMYVKFGSEGEGVGSSNGLWRRNDMTQYAVVTDGCRDRIKNLTPIEHQPTKSKKLLEDDFELLMPFWNYLVLDAVESVEKVQPHNYGNDSINLFQCTMRRDAIFWNAVIHNPRNKLGNSSDMFHEIMQEG